MKKTTSTYDTTLLDALRHDRLKSGSIDPEMESKMKLLKTEYEKMLKSAGFDLSKIYQTKDGRYKISRPVQACRKDILDIYEALYKHYYPDSDTFESVYEKWVDYFQELVDQGHREESALTRYKAQYRKYIKGSNIEGSPIVNLKIADFKALYRSVTADGAMDYKSLSLLKTLVNWVTSYARDELGYDDVVVTKGIRTTDLRLAEKDLSDDVYTKEEQEILLRIAWEKRCKSVYARAISLMGRLDIRIGELRALTWSDVDLENGVVYLTKQLVNRSNGYKVRDQKGNARFSKRAEPLTPQAIEILKLQKKKSPFSELIFVKDGTSDDPIDDDALNKALQRYSKEGHIRYMSSHKLRFFSVTYGLESGIELSDMQCMSGHMTPDMTKYYDRRKIIMRPAVDHATWASIVDVPGCTTEESDIKKAEAL